MGDTIQSFNISSAFFASKARTFELSPSGTGGAITALVADCPLARLQTINVPQSRAAPVRRPAPASSFQDSQSTYLCILLSFVIPLTICDYRDPDLLTNVSTIKSARIKRIEPHL